MGHFYSKNDFDITNRDLKQSPITKDKRLRLKILASTQRRKRKIVISPKNRRHIKKNSPIPLRNGVPLEDIIEEGSSELSSCSSDEHNKSPPRPILNIPNLSKKLIDS